MTNEIEKYEQQPIARAANGKPVRTSKEQLSVALAPMFATFPSLEMRADTFNAYYMMLCDLEPDKLAAAVIVACQQHEYPTQLITIAAIRKAYEAEQRPPGPSSDVDPTKLKPIPTKMFRLPEDEDRRQRMAQLRRTSKWGSKYA